MLPDSEMYDSESGGTLVTEKYIEMTEKFPHMPSEQRVFFLYTTAKRGRIVKMIFPYPGKDYGSSTHFFFDELSGEGKKDIDQSFQNRAAGLRVTPQQLLEIIKENAP